MSDREPADLLIEPRWLLPVSPSGTVLEAQAVAVGGGRILAVGPAVELRQRFAVRERLVRAQHALLPGFVNAHTCASHALLRGLPLRGPAARSLRGWVGLERRAGGADFVRDGTRLAIAEMLRAGITCFADLSPLPAEAARTAAAAQVRALIALPVSEAPSGCGEDATAHLAQAEALWDEYRAHPRIGLYFAPLPGSALSDATLTRLRRVADELDARIALDLGERRAPRAGYADGDTPRSGGVEDGGPREQARTVAVDGTGLEVRAHQGAEGPTRAHGLVPRHDPVERRPEDGDPRGVEGTDGGGSPPQCSHRRTFLFQRCRGLVRSAPAPRHPDRGDRRPDRFVTAL